MTRPIRRPHPWRAGALMVLLMAGLEPAPALAGMPSPFLALTELGRQRVATISFFLLLLLLCAGVVRVIWNGLARDFPRLPRLSFGKALGVVALWGLLFVIVLSMISGARELMTPGAWTPDGLTSRLTNPPPPPPPDTSKHDDRRQKLEDLRRVLWQYAETHEGRFPPDDSAPGIPGAVWSVPDPSGMRYLYAGRGKKADEGASPLAYEPGLFGPERLVLFTDGSIRSLPLPEIRRALEPGTP